LTKNITLVNTKSICTIDRNNELTLEQLRGEGVVGAINRLGRYPIFRRFTDGRVALSKDEDWMDVEGDAFVVVSGTGVMSEVNVHVFNAAGATIVAFPAAFTGPI
jgi:hypothetical protein